MERFKFTSIEELPLTLTVAQVKDILNVGRNTAYTLINSGVLSSIRIGHQLRVPKASLIAYMNLSHT